jgi:two-component system, OmpR family, response regulator
MTLKILHVEDEPDIREVAAMALDLEDDIDLTAATSGPEALALLDGFTPDAVLLDVMMPGMDGPSVLVELRKRPELEATPVIFMTARVQTSEVARYLELGAVGVITKPFDPMTLGREIKDILAGARA